MKNMKWFVIGLLFVLCGGVGLTWNWLIIPMLKLGVVAVIGYGIIVVIKEIKKDKQ